MRPLSVIAASCVTLAVLAVGPASSISASPAGPWKGTFTQTSGTVVVTSVDNSIRPLIVNFTDVPLECSDGSSFLQSWTAKGAMRKNGSFRIEQQFPREFGIQAYADTRGRLKHGRINGTFYELRVSLQPELVPSCATPYPLRWSAKRARR